MRAGADAAVHHRQQNATLAQGLDHFVAGDAGAGRAAWLKTSASWLAANSVPFVLDADPAGGPGILRAHVARANPLWREARTDVESLVVFQGPQAYISPNWYPSKQFTHTPDVPGVPPSTRAAPASAAQSGSSGAKGIRRLAQKLFRRGRTNDAA